MTTTMTPTTSDATVQPPGRHIANNLKGHSHIASLFKGDIFRICGASRGPSAPTELLVSCHRLDWVIVELSLREFISTAIRLHLQRNNLDAVLPFNALTNDQSVFAFFDLPLLLQHS